MPSRLQPGNCGRSGAWGRRVDTGRGKCRQRLRRSMLHLRVTKWPRLTRISYVRRSPKAVARLMRHFGSWLAGHSAQGHRNRHRAKTKLNYIFIRCLLRSPASALPWQYPMQLPAARRDPVGESKQARTGRPRTTVNTPAETGEYRRCISHTDHVAEHAASASKCACVRAARPPMRLERQSSVCIVMQPSHHTPYVHTVSPTTPAKDPCGE